LPNGLGCYRRKRKTDMRRGEGTAWQKGGFGTLTKSGKNNGGPRGVGAGKGITRKERIVEVPSDNGREINWNMNTGGVRSRFPKRWGPSCTCVLGGKPLMGSKSWCKCSRKKSAWGGGRFRSGVVGVIPWKKTTKQSRIGRGKTMPCTNKSTPQPLKSHDPNTLPTRQACGPIQRRASLQKNGRGKKEKEWEFVSGSSFLTHCDGQL